MTIGILKLTFYAPWVHSLKEKRMEVRKITKRAENKFNISIAETDFQDMHQKIGIGIVFIAGDIRMADSVIDHVLTFINETTEAELIDVDRNVENWN
ncbi:MAG: DUF503 domain-containing protein [Lachnospiraceae bacterium]